MQYVGYSFADVSIVLPSRFLSVFFSLSLSLALSHEHESLNVLWYLKDVFLRRHVGLGILEEAFRSQMFEWGAWVKALER